MRPLVLVLLLAGCSAPSSPEAALKARVQAQLYDPASAVINNIRDVGGGLTFGEVAAKGRGCAGRATFLATLHAVSIIPTAGSCSLT